MYRIKVTWSADVQILYATRMPLRTYMYEFHAIVTKLYYLYYYMFTKWILFHFIYFLHLQRVSHFCHKTDERENFCAQINISIITIRKHSVYWLREYFKLHPPREESQLTIQKLLQNSQGNINGGTHLYRISSPPELL